MRTPAGLAARAGRAFMRQLDSVVARGFGVEEFTQEEGCILRTAVDRARVALTLSDGTVVRPGDPVGEIHLWNTRMPAMGPDGPSLVWSRAFVFGLRRSMRALARYADTDHRFTGVHAFTGEFVSSPPEMRAGGLHTLQALGFDVIPNRRGKGLWGRFARFWENLFSWCLIWTYNPASLRSRRFRHLRRYYLWISRERMRGRR